MTDTMDEEAHLTAQSQPSQRVGLNSTASTNIDYFRSISFGMAYLAPAFAAVQRDLQQHASYPERESSLDILGEFSRALAEASRLDQKQLETLCAQYGNVLAQIFRELSEANSLNQGANRLGNAFSNMPETLCVPQQWTDLHEGPSSQNSPEKLSVVVEQPDKELTYWRTVRSTMQQAFAITLGELAPLIGIAYPTLVHLGAKRPHPSTSRLVMRIYSLVTDFHREHGEEAALTWFSTEGLSVIRRLGFDALKRAALRRIYGKPRAIGGIPLYAEADPETLDSDLL